MNNKKKGLIAISIFLVLFSGSLYTSHFSTRTIYEKGSEGTISIQQQGEGYDQSVPFNPREYIRIGNHVYSLD